MGGQHLLRPAVSWPLRRAGAHARATTINRPVLRRVAKLCSMRAVVGPMLLQARLSASVVEVASVEEEEREHFGEWSCRVLAVRSYAVVLSPQHDSCDAPPSRG